MSGSDTSQRPSEQTPLLTVDDHLGITPQDDGLYADHAGELFDSVPSSRRQIGTFSAVFLIFNRVIGTGIYATPSLILRSSGSIGMSLLMWLLGSIIACTGTTVYVELGTALPRSGGEKNYVEYIYRRPKYLASCIYAIFALLLGVASGTSVVFGEYVLHSLSLPLTLVNTRVIAVLALSTAFLVHAINLNMGLRIQNTFGLFMIAVLIFVAVVGALSLFGMRWSDSHDRVGNLDWAHLWDGTHLDANSIVTSLYRVSFCFVGYSNANYALSEVKDPIRTIKRAAPLAMIFLTLVYLLVNVAYYSIVSKKDILEGGTIVVTLLFRNLFGQGAEKVVSVIIAISTYGHILAVLFSQGRVVQELGREGMVPFASILASSRPFGTPLAGLSVVWLFSCIVAVAPPPGDAFNFIINVTSYPLFLINAFVAGGLLFLHSRRAEGWNWSPPFRSWTIVTMFFLLANVFFCIAPLIPPSPDFPVYDSLPYWSHVVICLVIGAAGVLYWYMWCIFLPKRGGYTLVRKIAEQDGISRNVFQKVPL